jgi:hypothetical protein
MLPNFYGYAVVLNFLNFLCLCLFGSSIVYSLDLLQVPVVSPEKLLG